MNLSETTLSDRFLLFLVKRSIREFKEFFPNEEPFIKIICLRDKRLQTEIKADNISWRSTKIYDSNSITTNLHDNKLKLTIEKKEIEKSEEFIKTTITKKVQDKESIKGETKIETKVTLNKIPSKYNRRSNTDTNKIKERIIKKTITNHEEVIEETPMNIQVEIVKDNLEHRGHFIQFNKTKTLLEINDSTVDTINKIKNSLIVQGDNFRLNEESIDSIISNIKQDELNECRDIIKSNINEPKTVREIVLSYINTQRKLNELKSRLTRFTYGFDQWDFLVKSKGFILSIDDLVRFWWRMCQDDDDY